jgi:hypothetical protein
MPQELSALNAAQLDFVKERTRQKLVGWAEYELEHETCPSEVVVDPPALYVEYAMSRGWLSKRKPRKLLSGGWKAAGAFLRR